jgi:hypothetical protein
MADGTPPLPEFTRALRALGSRRGRRGGRAAGADQQARFFAPLVDARSAAAVADDAAAVIAAFDGVALSAALRATLEGFARDRYPEYAPARRALEAELFDVAESLFASCEAVRAVASAARGAAAHEALARWSHEVQRLFECADRVWVLLDEVLETAATTELAAPLPTSRRARLRRKAP